jgi:hypothetical protein
LKKLLTTAEADKIRLRRRQTLFEVCHLSTRSLPLRFFFARWLTARPFFQWWKGRREPLLEEDHSFSL